MSRYHDNGLLWFRVAFVIIILVLIIIALVVIPFCTQEEIIVNATGKDIYTTTSCSKRGCNTYTHRVVFTTSGETFEVADNLFLWEFGCMEKFGMIESGKSYRFRVYGYFVPEIQSYRQAYKVWPV